MQPFERAEIILHSQRVLNSFKRWTGRELMPRTGDAAEQSRDLFEAPFVLVSDGSEPDPILSYGNAAALKLWEMSWEELTRIPSRQTAEPVHQNERAGLMAEVEAHGFIDSYKGVRIASSGRRFRIEQAVVWKVIEENGRYIGKAATFSKWVDIS
ncbi:MAG TPA: MEKHLA domain-containing protein [Planctomycetota bacterium]|jgi:hypothetical protein